MQCFSNEAFMVVHPIRMQTGIKKVVKTIKKSEVPSRPRIKLDVAYLLLETPAMELVTKICLVLCVCRLRTTAFPSSACPSLLISPATPTRSWEG